MEPSRAGEGCWHSEESQIRAGSLQGFSGGLKVRLRGGDSGQVNNHQPECCLHPPGRVRGLGASRTSRQQGSEGASEDPLFTPMVFIIGKSWSVFSVGLGWIDVAGPGV